MYLDKISEGFGVQGHRSKCKATSGVSSAFGEKMKRTTLVRLSLDYVSVSHIHFK